MTKRCLTSLLTAEQAPGQSGSRHWEDINLDLSEYKNQTVVLRLYQRVLVPHHEAGDAYWQDLTVK